MCVYSVCVNLWVCSCAHVYLCVCAWKRETREGEMQRPYTKLQYFWSTSDQSVTILFCDDLFIHKANGSKQQWVATLTNGQYSKESDAEYWSYTLSTNWHASNIRSRQTGTWQTCPLPYPHPQHTACKKNYSASCEGMGQPTPTTNGT